MPNALLLPRRQDCKLSGQQFLLERRNAGVENREAFPQSHQFVLLIEDQGPFHVELPGHQELDRGRPGIPFETHFGKIQVQHKLTIFSNKYTSLLLIDKSLHVQYIRAKGIVSGDNVVMFIVEDRLTAELIVYFD